MRLPLIYFDCVLAEASSTLTHRLREQRRNQELTGRLEWLLAVYPSEQLTWFFPDAPRLYGHIMEQIRLSAGELNCNDGLIALACRERWLTRVATPDDVTAALAALTPPEADTPESTEHA